MNKILFKLIEGKGKFFLMPNCPSEPNEKDFSGDQWKENEAWKAYNKSYNGNKFRSFKERGDSEPGGTANS